MEKRVTPLERAFDLANSGRFNNVAEIRTQLTKERLSTDQITGGSLKRQIQELIATALAERGNKAQPAALCSKSEGT